MTPGCGTETSRRQISTQDICQMGQGERAGVWGRGCVEGRVRKGGGGGGRVEAGGLCGVVGQGLTGGMGEGWRGVG